MEDMKMNIRGHIKIWDADTKELLVDQDNGINFENMAVALCQSIASGPLNVGSAPGFIYSMNFGNGGTTVSPTGVIAYNPPNIIGVNATLYNQTYSKVINNNFSADVDTTNNYISILHTTGTTYADIFVNCQLDYSEPAGQAAFDNTTTFKDTYTFDEMGLFSTSGQLLTHVIFSPVQKALNRRLVFEYLVRISSLTTLVSQ
jgi:hypothetical protein